MTPLRCDQFLALSELALAIMDREDVPQDLRNRAAFILKQAPAEVARPAHAEEPPAQIPS